MSQCLCDRCSALCCRYFALPIDTPETPAQFDDIRWYLAHESVHVFVEEGGWYLSVQTRCQFLQEDNRCGIYEDRPRVCREYTTDNCDYYVGQYEFDHYFTTPEQLEAYAQQTLGGKMTRYAVTQRARNTGQPARGPGKPDPQHVLHHRVRPSIRAHPGQKRPQPHPSTQNPIVPLSIRGANQ